MLYLPPGLTGIHVRLWCSLCGHTFKKFSWLVNGILSNREIFCPVGLQRIYGFFQREKLKKPWFSLPMGAFRAFFSKRVLSCVEKCWLGLVCVFVINVNVWFSSVTDGGSISSLNFYSGICGICFGTNTTLPDWALEKAVQRWGLRPNWEPSLEKNSILYSCLCLIIGFFENW